MAHMDYYRQCFGPAGLVGAIHDLGLRVWGNGIASGSRGVGPGI